MHRLCLWFVCLPCCLCLSSPFDQHVCTNNTHSQTEDMANSSFARDSITSIAYNYGVCSLCLCFRLSVCFTQHKQPHNRYHYTMFVVQHNENENPNGQPVWCVCWLQIHGVSLFVCLSLCLCFCVVSVLVLSDCWCVDHACFLEAKTFRNVHCWCVLLCLLSFIRVA